VTLCRTYKSVANLTAKSGYRGDLRKAAVARASAIKKSQRPVKETPEKKLRGKKAAAASSE
jgi:large subunit ribosomal protein L28e